MTYTWLPEIQNHISRFYLNQRGVAILERPRSDWRACNEDTRVYPIVGEEHQSILYLQNGRLNARLLYHIGPHVLGVNKPPGLMQDLSNQLSAVALEYVS